MNPPLSPADDRRIITMLLNNVNNVPGLGNIHGGHARARQLLHQYLLDVDQPVPFAFDGRCTFHTKRGRWQPKALSQALTLFLTAHCMGGELCIAGVSYGAVHGALNRQIESLYRVDPDLANALAFGHGDAEGLHLRKDDRYSRLFWSRWQPPRGMRLGAAVSAP